jgi:glycosyl transferase family 25
MNIPVFVINLKSSVDRKVHTINQLNDLDIPFQIIEAVDKFDSSVLELVDKHRFNLFEQGLRSRYLLHEEIGCVLSHVKVYQKLVDENIELACILEDDNDYEKDFKDLLILNNLNVVDWDILHLGHHSGIRTKGTRSKNKIKLKLNGYSIGEPIEIPLGTYAYIIKKDAAKMLIKHCFPVRMPADHYTGNANALGYRSFVFSPPCVFPNCSFNSTIQNVKNIKFENVYIESIRKYIQKSYQLFPWLYSFRMWIHVNKHFHLIILRKIGLIKNTYAKFK